MIRSSELRLAALACGVLSGLLCWLTYHLVSGSW